MKKATFMLFLAIASTQVFAQSFYPLALGNRWTYHTYNSSTPEFPRPIHHDTVTVLVLSDTVMANGYHYFHLSHGDVASVVFVRRDSSSIRCRIQSLSSDAPVYDLTSKVGDSTFSGTDWITCMTRIDTLQLFGVSTAVRTYSTFEGMGFIGQVRYSDKFGPLTQWYYGEDPPPPWPMFTMELIGCTLDGVSYGVTVGVRQQPLRPYSFALLGNYPNPFNPETTIEYSLKERADIVITVSDLLGRTLWHASRLGETPGIHSIRWDGRTDFGEVAGSGVYFYTLRSNAGSVSQRMLLVK